MNSPVLPTAATLASSAFQPGDILVGGALRRLPRDARSRTAAASVPVVLARGHATRLISAPSCSEERRRGRDHPGPGSAGDLDPSLLLQQEQRLAHGRPPHAEPRRQLLLGRQMGAHLELVGDDQRLELLGDVVSALAPSDRQLAERRREVTASRTARFARQRSRLAGSNELSGRSPYLSTLGRAGRSLPGRCRPFAVHGPKCQSYS